MGMIRNYRRGARDMKELRTEIEIKASPEKVWKILTDLTKYPEWNPFFHHAIGTVTVGGKVDITFLHGSRDMTLHCTVVKVELNRMLSWKYHVIFPFLWNSEHSFTIELLGSNRIRFIDIEVFKGWLIPSQTKDIDITTRRDFMAMDRALKARAEKT
jgi:hypothetical protein